jgi:putative salt-induced outer membrane protein
MIARRCVSTPILTSALLLASRAKAQDLPQGTLAQPPVSKGSTDLTAQKFEAAAAAANLDQAKDASELTLGLGGLVSTGNSRLIAVTVNGQFRIRRTNDQLAVAAAGNYSRTAPPGHQLQTTVENVQGKMRYDRFFCTDWTGFLGVQVRNDRFQGLDLRLQVDPGIAYYFVNEAKERMWAEAGYDLLHDIRRDQDLVVLDMMGIPTGELLDKTQTVQSARVFFGYDNQLNEAVTFTLGLEYLQGLSRTSLHRFNVDAKLTSKLGHGFSLATSFSLRYDNEPLPGKEDTDTVSAVNLVYKIL